MTTIYYLKNDEARRFDDEAWFETTFHPTAENVNKLREANCYGEAGILSTFWTKFNLLMDDGDVVEALECIFGVMQNHEENWTHGFPGSVATMDWRSMSVGDLVQLDNQDVYVVAGCGFEKVNTNQEEV
tara:strand:- start:580 stop:966 length:387 start_codon:yes stop_codon:yes gene_type:complete